MSQQCSARLGYVHLSNGPSIWSAMGQAWDKKLTIVNSKLIPDWCSELREIWTMSINRLFRIWLYDLILHIRRSNVHRGISARWNNVKTDLCNREMSFTTHQTHDNTEVRNPGRSLRSSSQAANAQRTRCQNRQTLKIDQLISGTTEDTRSAQETTSVRCEQQQNYFKTDQWRHVKVVKTLPTSETEECSLKDSGSPCG